MDWLWTIVIWVVALIVPMWKLLDRTGKSQAWMLCFLIPGIGVFIVLYVVAFGRWNTVAGGGELTGRG